MNEEETYMGEWPVKPYYKRDLAMGYAPDITPVAALNRLSAWIHHHKPLYQALLDSGYADRQRIFNSVQVGLIFHLFGKTVGVGRPYAWFYTSVCADLCIRMYRLTQTYM
jgi:hypothetical protein